MTYFRRVIIVFGKKSFAEHCCISDDSFSSFEKKTNDSESIAKVENRLLNATIA